MGSIWVYNINQLPKQYSELTVPVSVNNYCINQPDGVTITYDFTDFIKSLKDSLIQIYFESAPLFLLDSNDDCQLSRSWKDVLD